MDNRPFPELRTIIRELADERIWAYAEWVSSQAARQGPAVCCDALGAAAAQRLNA